MNINKKANIIISLIFFVIAIIFIIVSVDLMTGSSLIDKYSQASGNPLEKTKEVYSQFTEALSNSSGEGGPKWLGFNIGRKFIWDFLIGFLAGFYL